MVFRALPYARDDNIKKLIEAIYSFDHSAGCQWKKISL